jgi:acetylornithine deacetylase/succinyl-diaminopimelate desuccinylase-like protein
LNLSLSIQTSHKDNHSGLYGGAIPNPVLIFAEILSKMYQNNILYLPGLKNCPEEIQNLLNANSFVENTKNIPFSENEFLYNTGAKIRLNNDILNFYFQVGYFTSAEVTGLVSGYTGEGYRNAIPGKLAVKINFRISPFHTVKDVLSSFQKFLQQNIPSYVDYKIDVSSESAEPIIIDTSNEYIQKAIQDLCTTYSQNPSLKFSGAIVPICGLFQSKLGIDRIISVGIANEDCNMHGANENLSISSIENAIKFADLFLST